MCHYHYCWQCYMSNNVGHVTWPTICWQSDIANRDSIVGNVTLPTICWQCYMSNNCWPCHCARLLAMSPCQQLLAMLHCQQLCWQCNMFHIVGNVTLPTIFIVGNVTLPTIWQCDIANKLLAMYHCQIVCAGGGPHWSNEELFT